MQTDYQRIEKAIKYIEENFRSQPSLEDIAKHIHLSQFHFQKLFTKWAGISPKKFLEVLTLDYTKKRLEESEDIFDAIYDSGLSSTSRLHELFVNIEAITPSEFKKLGSNLKIKFGFHETIFGLALIAITTRGICALHFIEPNKKKEFLKNLKRDWPNAEFIQDQRNTKKVIENIFNNNGSDKLNLLVKGTNFQIQVWKALLKIPSGNITSYEKIARYIRHPKATRAVGSAIGKNPISFIIPCHRVINKLGVIGNYRWGRERKKAILAWEARV